MPRQWVSWGKQATKERFPKSKPIPGPKDQGFPHTREQQPKENKPNKKRVNPQPWSTTGRTTGPYQPGGSPRSLSPPRCRRSTQGFGDAHSRRDGTQNLSQTPQVSHYRDIPGDEINHGKSHVVFFFPPTQMLNNPKRAVLFQMPSGHGKKGHPFVA